MKAIKILILLLTVNLSYAQLEMRSHPYQSGKIILNNNEVKQGYIKLDYTAYDILFKKTKDQKDESKVNYKDVKKMVIRSDKFGDREFYYMATNLDRFKKFVELIHQGNIYLYVNSPKDLSLFYKGVDRSNVIDFIPSKNPTNHPDFPNTIPEKQKSMKEIREELATVVNPRYFIPSKDSEKLILIKSNKHLRKIAPNYFKDCPTLIEKIEDKEYKKNDILEIIQFYNECIKTN